MLKRNLVKLIGSIILGGVVILGALPACGSSAGVAMPIPVAPEAAVTVTETPVSSPTANSDSSDLLAQGKLIYEETAGGVGCASCHGLGAKGGGAGPDIRGTESSQIRQAVRGGVPAMSFIKLNDEEMKAVIAHIQFLSQ